MKALLLRVGIDLGSDGALAPIFGDGTFEYIPISEMEPKSKENKTYGNTRGIKGKPFSHYLPKKLENKILHYDPEFETFTYGDPTAKRTYLLKLQANDLLVFYAGLIPYENEKYPRGLYIIAYFIVKEVIDFNNLSNNEIEGYENKLFNNAHMKRGGNLTNLIIIVGDQNQSRILNNAVLISQINHAKNGYPYYAVSQQMETYLGIKGSIQRSIPPRFIKEEINLSNLKNLLNI